LTFRTPGIGRRLGTGRTRLVLPALVTSAALLIAYFVFAAIWTNLLWYRSVGFSSVYTTQLWAKLVLFFGSGLLMALVVGANMVIAYRLRPAYRPLSVEQQGLERYRTVIDPRRRLISAGLLGLLALLTGSSVAGQWPTFLAFLHRTSFGVKDPQFHKDVSFYVFTYPFVRMILGVVFATVILSILATVVVHYLYGGLRLQGPGDKASGPARAHLSVLVGIFVLLKAFAYWFDRYGLVHSERGAVTGASYADVNALLPAKTILALIAIICAALFFVNITRRGMMLPGVGFTLLVVSAVLVGGLYPLLIQQFQVKPDEQAKERQYIARNIAMTRKAYGVEDTTIAPYGDKPETDPKKLQEAASGLTDVRLLDPNVISPTFLQLQQKRPFYKFPDTLDVDRYQVGDKSRDAIVAVRELSGAPSGQRSWVKDRMVYTHGYGFVSADGGQIAEGGTPQFLTKDMPTKDGQGNPPSGALRIDKPQIYFGEQSNNYSVVGGDDQQELDYPSDAASGQANTTYTGSGGVRVDSFLRKFLFATKFQDKNLLLSGAIKPGAKILYNRNPREMVHRAAPWLTLDGNLYPAVVGGRILWIVDGYTTSNNFPYSESMSLGDATRDTITDTRSAVAKQANDHINYMRNSVKATVDAYDGTVRLYQWDDKDPVAKTWMKVFPKTVQPKSDIAKVPGLMEHFRYPQDLFKVQRKILTNYHVTDPDAYYGAQGFWQVPQDPTSQTKIQPPYYQSVQMPGSPSPQFSLTSALTPKQNNNLAAFMAVDSTPGPTYGKIRILELPRNQTTEGPVLAHNALASDPAVQRQLYPLNQNGSKTQSGNLLSLPFAGGILYIEPVYAKGQQPYPILRQVLVRYGDRSAIADNLPDALKSIFGGGTAPTQGGTDQPGNGQMSPAVQAAINDLNKAIGDFEKAQREQNYTAMGDAWKRITAARDALSAAQQAAAKAKPTPSPSPTPSGTPTPTGSPSTTPTG
jgi:uncharacterized membrane protein (UPF0182 family)